MGKYIARRVVKLMISNETIIEGSNVLILGFTFKENCPDIRNTKVIDIIEELKDYNVRVKVYDPWVDQQKIPSKYKVNFINDLNGGKYNAIILAVCHNEFLNIDFNLISDSNTIIFDIKSFLPKMNNRHFHKL